MWEIVKLHLNSLGKTWMDDAKWPVVTRDKSLDISLTPTSLILGVLMENDHFIILDPCPVKSLRPSYTSTRRSIGQNQEKILSSWTRHKQRHKRRVKSGLENGTLFQRILGCFMIWTGSKSGKEQVNTHPHTKSVKRDFRLLKELERTDQWTTGLSHPWSMLVALSQPREKNGLLILALLVGGHLSSIHHTFLSHLFWVKPSTREPWTEVSPHCLYRLQPEKRVDSFLPSLDACLPRLQPTAAFSGLNWGEPLPSILFRWHIPLLHSLP